MELKILPVSGQGANCYLIKTENAALVIDPFEAYPEIIDFFEKNSAKEKIILLTHRHFDHILGVFKLHELFGAKIIIGEMDEVGLRESEESLSSWVGLEQVPIEADITVSDGEVLNLGGTEFKVLHTPGHTVGSVCYIAEDCVFSGDTLFRGTVGRTDLPTGSNEALKLSLSKLKTLDKNYKVYPGHGSPTTLEDEIKNNPYMK